MDALCNKTGETALTAACGSGNFCLAVVDTLIQRGADLYIANERGMDALYLAARGGYNVIVERLLIAGVTSTNQNKNPLIIASAEGHPNVVEILLDHSNYLIFNLELKILELIIKNKLIFHRSRHRRSGQRRYFSPWMGVFTW